MADRLGRDHWLHLVSLEQRAVVLTRWDDTGDRILADGFGRRLFACQRDELVVHLARGAIWRVPEPIPPAALIRRRLEALHGQLRARPRAGDNRGPGPATTAARGA